jgi:hypothetical protein
MCCCRYLRARDWHLDKVEAMLRETIQWRRESKPSEITQEEIADVMVLCDFYYDSHYVFAPEIGGNVS